MIGGANSAGQAALFLASRGSHVDLVVRGADIRTGMSTYLVERLEAHPMVQVRTGSNVLGLAGADRLMSVVIGHDSGVEESVESHAVFCFVGADPATGWLTGVELDEDGFVLTDVRLGPDAGSDRLPFQTNLPGVFAAGDVRAGSMKRVAAAVGEGASAVASVTSCSAARSRARGRQPPRTASSSISTFHRGSSRAATTTMVLAGCTAPKTSPWTAPTASPSAASTTYCRVRMTSSTVPPSSSSAVSMISQQRRAWIAGSGSTEPSATPAPYR